MYDFSNSLNLFTAKGTCIHYIMILCHILRMAITLFTSHRFLVFIRAHLPNFSVWVETQRKKSTYHRVSCGPYLPSSGACKWYIVTQWMSYYISGTLPSISRCVSNILTSSTLFLLFAFLTTKASWSASNVNRLFFEVCSNEKNRRIPYPPLEVGAYTEPLASTVSSSLLQAQMEREMNAYRVSEPSRPWAGTVSCGPRNRHIFSKCRPRCSLEPSSFL